MAAIVVLYYPQPSTLERLVSSLACQTHSLIVVDNTPIHSSRMPVKLPSKADAASFERVTYIPLNNNYGLAFAQNIGIEAARTAGYSHVLLLDQDSAASPNMVDSLIAAEAGLLLKGSSPAAVGPLFFEEKSGSRGTAIRYRGLRIERPRIDPLSSDPVETDYVIASGSLIRLSVLNAVGPMNEDLFIDWVDIEWGLRAAKHGYQSYIVPAAVMSHSIGDAAVSAVAREVHLHTDTRNYYIVRNGAYLIRSKIMSLSWKLLTAAKLPVYIGFFSWHSPTPLNSLALLSRGLVHGLRGRLGKLI